MKGSKSILYIRRKVGKVEVTDSSNLLDSTDDDLDLAYIQSEFQKV